MSLVAGQLGANDGARRRQKETEKRFIAIEKTGGFPLTVDERSFFDAQELGVLELGRTTGTEIDASVEAHDDELIGCDLGDQGAATQLRCLGAEDSAVLDMWRSELDQDVVFLGANEFLGQVRFFHSRV